MRNTGVAGSTGRLEAKGILVKVGLLLLPQPAVMVMARASRLNRVTCRFFKIFSLKFVDRMARHEIGFYSGVKDAQGLPRPHAAAFSPETRATRSHRWVISSDGKD